jgi:DNA-binding NarL/FixJ family response regulator
MIRVFLVDDHAVVRDGLRAVLETHPHIQVVGDAANGLEATRQVRELRPEVVIMDIWMPELDGFEATRQILEIDRGIKVLFLTMLGTPEHVQRALQAGARGYLLKESAGREVVDAVLAVAAGQQYFSQAITRTLVTTYLGQPSSPPQTGRLDRLSSREREVLKWVVRGKSSAEIAELLHLSPKTVESYRSRLMQKLEIDDLPSLVRFAIQQGLLPLE